MKRNWKTELLCGVALLLLFGLWTVLIMHVDVQPTGQKGTNIGFATVNHGFHAMTGVHMALYTWTDWLGLVPVFVGFSFAMLGLAQWIKRRNLLKVDGDILLLGIYYVLVIAGYLVFEMIPINYRPVLIEGRLEASYPSSTTLLVLSVMPTLSLQIGRRGKRRAVYCAVYAAESVFSAGMVLGRLFSGVHWLTDIIGAVLFSAGLFRIYRACVMMMDRKMGVGRQNHGVS